MSTPTAAASAALGHERRKRDRLALRMGERDDRGDLKRARAPGASTTGAPSAPGRISISAGSRSSP